MTANLDSAPAFDAAPPRPAPPPTREDILSALRWSAPREVQTKLGPRIVTSADANPLVFDLWRAESAALKSDGYSLSEFRGKWQLSRWEKMQEKIVVKREEAKALSRATDADINVPAPEGCAYLGYQRAGIAFAHERPAVLIGDEMGLGKTVQAIGVINADPTLRRILVICPASLKLNWRRELEKWMVRKRAILIADSKTFVPLADGIVIVNYDVLHRHEAELRDTEWDCVIADEAHYLKNPKARRSKMVFGAKATKEEKAQGMADVPGITARKRILLTGTPIANKPVELFPLIEYLDPITWSNFFRFAIRYCAARQDGYGWDFSGASHLDELQDKLRSTIMVRRLKKDVLTELPPKRRQVVEFPADTPALRAVARAELAAYEGTDELEADVELAAASDDPHAYEAAVQRLRKGQQVLFEGLSELRRQTAEAKIPLCVEHIAEAVEESGKVVVFVWHKSVARAIENHFNRTRENRRNRGTDVQSVDGNSRGSEGSLRASESSLPLSVRSGARSGLQDDSRGIVKGLSKVSKTGNASDVRDAGIQPLAQCQDTGAQDSADIFTQDRGHRDSRCLPASGNPDSPQSPEKVSREQPIAGPHSIGQGIHAGQRLGDQLESERHQTQRDDRGTRNSREKFACGDGAAVVLMGDTPLAERQDAVDRFQRDPACKVFIGSIMAAGVGITLTAAAHVIFCELDWVPGNVSQAEDRCHRIGQRESVLVQHLVLEGSLDATMARRIIAKQDVIDRALDTVTAPADGEPTPRPRHPEMTDLAAQADRLTSDQREAAAEAIRLLRDYCNGAATMDGAGFSKIDVRIGHSLAAQSQSYIGLTPKQAALARKVALKYRRQLPAELVSRLSP